MDKDCTLCSVLGGLRLPPVHEEEADVHVESSVPYVADDLCDEHTAFGLAPA